MTWQSGPCLPGLGDPGTALGPPGSLEEAARQAVILAHARWALLKAAELWLRASKTALALADWLGWAWLALAAFAMAQLAALYLGVYQRVVCGPA